MSHRTLTVVAAAVLTAGLSTATALSAQVRVERAPSRALVQADAIELENLTRETFAALDNDRKIVHGGQEMTVGEMKAAAEAQRSAVVELIAGARIEARRHLEMRQREIAARDAVRREAEIAAATQALEDLAQRATRVRPVKRRVLRRDDG